ncbi:zinc ribbon domain-containing protein [Saccharicrinis fermentans]|uniref:Putative zinc ribbon domain protein n=1 Tax=Saccharicrinis fermentans DSM 9555 = JCM 21142 TaxID=869213 RepID=W7Y1M5_9BACT|nr:C4-type zinc ribbon domain-containing protein [Saccharicrinis fermentans]GAF01403.1 putative zinc ribbon domain protein [Saccharicrinis fermentans DSM 9555 = JCM 21142]
MATKNKNAEMSVEEKLKALYDLQKVATEVDKIRTLRGELPLEVQDLEDEIEGLETRISNHDKEVKALNDSISAKKNEIKESGILIKKYEAQQSNVRNNREFDSLSKEVEFQKLEIELGEKRIKEFTAELSNKESVIESSRQLLEDRKADLAAKKKELTEIVGETQVDEERKIEKIAQIESTIEERLLIAFKRIRKNAINGLAVVTVERDACGDCFNKIPPQRQLDIKSRKKVIVCEYCGRILVDDEIDQKPVEE